MKPFSSEEKHFAGWEPNGMWSDAPSANSKRRAGLSSRRIARSFENSKVGENEARKPMPTGSSRVQSQSQSSISRRTLFGRANRETLLCRLCFRRKTFSGEGDGKQTLGRFSSSKQTDWFSAEYASMQRNLRRNFLVEKFRYTYIIKQEWIQYVQNFPELMIHAQRGVILYKNICWKWRTKLLDVLSWLGNLLILYARKTAYKMALSWYE